MRLINFKFWIRLSLINLAIVALLGVIMRYKIMFYFPYLKQKFVQHAHSHFAFTGWISQVLLVVLVYSISAYLSQKALAKYRLIFIANLVSAYGMLISFSLQGYRFISISFSTLSILVAFLFAYCFIKDIWKIKQPQLAKTWYIAGLAFNVLSAAGTFSLAFVMAKGFVVPDIYLASIYFFLHFQYNGWFIFATIGLFVNYLQMSFPSWKLSNKVFYLAFIACIPAYGLSMLWLNPSLWINGILAGFAVLQLLSCFYLLKEIKPIRKSLFEKLNTITKLLIIISVVSLLIKLTLQLCSAIPALHQLAFGSRPIVIAYLHLVLLGFISLALLAYLQINQLLIHSKLASFALVLFIAGLFVNELVLMLQGIRFVYYFNLPHSDLLLLIAAICLFISSTLFALSQRKLN